MKNYNPNSYGVHKITVTLQIWDYIGHIFLEVSGNCKGLEVLNFSFSASGGNEDSDCNFTYHEDSDLYTLSLKNEKGEVLEVEDNAYELDNYVVGIEITDFIEE